MRIHKKGFTLIELIVVLSLIGIVIQMGYSMLLYGNNTFNLSTSRGLSQQNVRLAETFLTNELKYINHISLTSDDFLNNFYSLKYENGALIKSRHVTGDVDNPIITTELQRIAGDWDTINISNPEPGEIHTLVGQAELVGNKTSRFELPFVINTINNPVLIFDFTLDLVSTGQPIYYQSTLEHMSLLGDTMSIDIKDSMDSDDSDDTDDTDEDSPANPFLLNNSATLTLKIDSNDVIQSSNSESKNIDKGNHDFEFSVNGNNLNLEGTSITINSNTVDTNKIVKEPNSIRFTGKYNFNNFRTSYTIRVNVKNGVYQKDYDFVFQTNDNK